MYYRFIITLLILCTCINTDFDCITNRVCSKELHEILTQESESQVALFYCMRMNRISQQIMNIKSFIECLRGKQDDVIYPLVKCADENCL